MAHHSTVFAQLLKLVPRHRFEQLAQKHHHGQRFRRTSRWSQFVALAMGQLSGRCSLRDIVENAEAQVRRWYHLGVRSIKRSTLSRVNNEQPAQLYEELFGLLYERCRGLAPRHRFRFKHPLYSLDASVIELSLRIFPWAKYLHTKGGMKVHLSLDHSGYIPSFAVLTDGCKNEAPVGRQFDFPPGSVVVFDRGYTDYLWYKSLTHRGIYFVTRLRKNARYTVLERRRVDRRSGLTSDQTIRLTGPQLRGVDMPLLRHVGYRDPETGKHYVFLTNAFHLSARTIAELYKERWQIELFFKWIKQNLKIKAFVGTSRNAVMTQIWIALCVSLLVAYLKFISRCAYSAQQLLRLLQLNLFVRRNLFELLCPPPPLSPHPKPPQLALL
nr:IS4 family transposase [Gammaproteobacteria bacterium]